MTARTAHFARHRAAAPTIRLPIASRPMPASRRHALGRVLSALGAVLAVSARTRRAQFS